ncbi:N-glycosylase/DNA lyase [Halarchaeum rubridurum]|uniref:DNA-(apurinic or apyrimidinic site) lyase n=1 Tax=Halarchaeum rubridurum TaxID=489911 RepID=A0A830FR89_9EURY|nr:DNA-3-methyladenine glycosylase 2 family protein [Halarchaeum rubridurum]MBP1953647.1 N-glycosylase/DNA lyase [Halarchaeum rubridurum]GGM63717.1 8-oxoguanine DNA glycosylase [Halarchaeum rubridurum]
MRTGSVPLADLAGGFDLQATLESGQTYLWTREDGATYDADGARGGDAWYSTVVDGEVLRVRQRDGLLEWESTTDAESLLFDLLALDDDLHAIRAGASDDDLIRAAYERYWGLRIVRDPFFGCLVSFICSAQMRVGRIFAMQEALRETYGEPVAFDGRTYHAFPTPAALADASEGDLRDLSLGYRAPYVARTAEMVASGELTESDVRGADLEATREALKGYVGVGDKVADCIALFSLGYRDAVPLDTWIRTAIDEYYPNCARGNYAETSRAIRDAFGPNAGYTQTYVFHYLRSGDDEDGS